MAIAIRQGRLGRRWRGQRRECESCRVQSAHTGLAHCPNCGHPYGMPPAPKPLGVAPHPVLQMVQERSHR